jgi:acyl carrier protein
VNADNYETSIKAALYSVAPDLAAEPLDADARYRDQFEFDSMDLLRFILEVHRLTGIDIPESDYRQLETLNGGVAYLRSKGTQPD